MVLTKLKLVTNNTMSIRTKSIFVVAWILIWNHTILSAAITPFTPKNENLVLYTLTAFDQARSESNRTQNETPKTDWSSLQKHIEQLINTGREKADPRYFGYASALLKPMITKQDTPLSLKLQWADILQHNHDYLPALILLQELIEARPNWSQAHLMRASIYQAQGQHNKAMRDCTALLGHASMLVTSTCIAESRSMQGALKSAYDLLKQAHQNSADGQPGVMAWSYSILGQLAQRLGNLESAEIYFQKGLTNKGDDYYLLASYADLLLSHHRYIDTLELLKKYSYVDSLLMRLSIAEKRINTTGVPAYQKLLKQRIKDQIDTNRQGHLRQLALYQLHIDNNPIQAMITAQQNWQTQKQIEDGLVLAESAILANRKDIAKPVLNWLESNTGSDHRVTTLLKNYGT